MKRKSAKCYYCGKAITFSHNIRSLNGKLIPLEPDETTYHDCLDSPYNKKRKREALPEQSEFLRAI